MVVKVVLMMTTVIIGDDENDDCDEKECFVQVLLVQPFAVVATNRPKPSIFEAPSDAKTANFSTDSFLSFVFENVCFSAKK